MCLSSLHYTAAHYTTSRTTRPHTMTHHNSAPDTYHDSLESAARCSTLQHTATASQARCLTQCATMHHPPTHYNCKSDIYHDSIESAARCSTLQHTSTHCNTLQLQTRHIAPLHRVYTTLQDPATHLQHIRKKIATASHTIQVGAHADDALSL